MRNYFLCHGCGNQLPIPDSLQNEPVSRSLNCQECGQEFFWDAGLTNHHEPQPLNSVANTIEPLLELELEMEPHDSEQDPVPSNATDWSMLAAATQRRPRKETSAFRKIAPPVLGGLAAFPLATMIMWYGFGRDIGSAGPTVAQFVPWIVPERLREMPGGYSRGEATSTRPYPRRFPSINNNQRSIDASPETRFQKPAQEDGKTPSMPSAPDILDEPPHESGPSIAETIAKLRQLQKDWSATPREQQAEMVRQYCVEIKQLSKVSAELKGPSSVVWRKEIASLSREILSHSKMPTVIQMGATGSWKGVAPTLPNDFVATVINVRNENEPNSNAAWMLQEKWRYGTVDVAIEILPGAWPAGSLPISENCLLFGRLLLKSDSVDAANDLVADYLVLRVHAVFLPHASPSNR